MIKQGTKIELLAPAKDKKTAIAAINSGADAVYIGFLKFGARKAAGNSLEDIAEIVQYADIYRVNVYVTLNTIYTDEELPLVIDTIKRLYDIGVSAIIIQDMGILNSKLPPIRIFASTQCHNNTLEKVKFLENIGIERVILPREFSVFDIENISNNTNIDIETFIHGALCVSYSGQCYLSCANGGRSANRGDCAQPCRKKYSLKSLDGKIISKPKYLLSMKDLNLSGYIKKLITCGVSSFKIEGRLKDEAYVKNVVAFYRQKIDKVLNELKLEKTSAGISYPNFLPNASKSFNRGFTEFFIDGKRKNVCSLDYVKSIGEFSGKVIKQGKNYFTLDKNILNNGDGICFFDCNGELDGTKVIRCDNNKIFPQSMLGIKPGVKIFRNFDKNFNKKLMCENVERKISVYADFKINDDYIELRLSDVENNFANSIIKGCFELPKKPEQAVNSIKEHLCKTGGTEFEVAALYFDETSAKFIPAAVLNKLRRETVLKLQEVRRKNLIREKRKGNIIPAQYPEKVLNYTSNIYNSSAEAFYRKCGADVIEKALESKSSFDSAVLMITKHCIKYTLGLCKKYFPEAESFNEPLILTDEKNNDYILHFDCKNCVMIIKNQ